MFTEEEIMEIMKKSKKMSSKKFQQFVEEEVKKNLDKEGITLDEAIKMTKLKEK